MINKCVVIKRMANATNATNTTQCYGNGQYTDGKCSCKFFYDSTSECEYSYYVTVSPSFFEAYITVAFVLYAVNTILYVSESVIDFRRYGSSIIKKNGPLSKLSLLVSLVFDLVYLCVFTYGYIHTTTEYSYVAFMFQSLGAAILLMGHGMCVIRWFELLVKAEYFAGQPRYLVSIRKALIIVLWVIVPILVVTATALYLINNPALASVFDTVNTVMWVLGFCISLFISSGFIIKSLCWIDKIDITSERITQLIFRTKFLLVANIIVIFEFVYVILGEAVSPSFAVTFTAMMVVENAMSIVMFIFLQNYSFRGCTNPFVNYKKYWSESATISSNSESNSSKTKSGSRSRTKSSSVRDGRSTESTDISDPQPRNAPG